jgi:hypothetical protein
LSEDTASGNEALLASAKAKNPNRKRKTYEVPLGEDSVSGSDEENPYQELHQARAELASKVGEFAKNP